MRKCLRPFAVTLQEKGQVAVCRAITRINRQGFAIGLSRLDGIAQLRQAQT